MVFLPCFSPHGRWKTAENSLHTRGSLLPLLDFVDVLREQLPMCQGTPSCGRCSNMVDAHNTVIRKANCDNLPRSTSARFCARMGLSQRPLIPLIVELAERMEDSNELATTASPATQRHIRHVQCQDRTHSTLTGASCEGDEVALSPDGGDTSPPHPH